MPDVILDANFLVIPFQFKVDIFEEIDRLVDGRQEIFTLDRTLNEALNLKDGEYRSMVKKLVDLKDVQILNTKANMPVDDQLFQLGREGFIICTNDKELKRRLEREELPYIYLRQQNHLEGAHLSRQDGG